MNQKTTCALMITVAAATMIVTSAPLRASETDDRIESSFEKTYVYKTYLKDDAVEVEAKDGIVTLTGTVAEESSKALAQDTVESLPGVTSVDNQLVTKAEAATVSADTWIGRKVKFALLLHRHVSYSATTVDVKDGVVTLKGKAISAAQKDLTTEYASDIEGVKSVKNEMTVATAPVPAERTSSEKIDDASITAQVKTALSTHHSTSAISTKVQTRDGAVALTGIAKNAAEKALVTKLATDIQGVTSVNNQMTIAETKAL